MGTPRNFELDPIDPSDRPAPSPPKLLKHQMYSDPAVFKAFDKHAIDEARTNYRTFRDLIWNLICKKNFNQLQKCRAIFRWMTTKNMYTIMFDSELPGSPEQVLSGFKDGRVTYARIFEILCHYAGLHCVTISGWAKGVDYRPGHPITQTAINHSWNAVYLDGNWQLVDTHWATRYLQNERNAPDNLVYEYDDFYFLPEPGHLIYSHCPEDPTWQLLKPAVSKVEYEEYPLVKSFFFTVGMEYLQQNTGVIHTVKGLTTITLGFAKPAAFTFKLLFGEKMAEAIQGINLKRYIIQETTKDRVTFYFRAPREGNYYLTIFAQKVGEKLKVENIFKAACEYKIVADSTAGDIRPYPQCNDSNWGPGAPVRQYGLEPSYKAAILSAPNGRAELNFRRKPGHEQVRLYARLVRDGIPSETLETAVDVQEQDDMVYIKSELPTRGEYGLEVYANDPDREGDTFTHMCQYLVSYLDRDLGAQYGQVYDRLDLGYSMQAQPELWEQDGAGGHYGSMPRGDMRYGPNGTMPRDQRYGSQGSLGSPSRTGPQQYDYQMQGAGRGQYTGGQYPHSQGQYSTMPARPSYGSQTDIPGVQGAQAHQPGSYGSLPRGGSGGAAVVGYGSTPSAAAPEQVGVGNVQYGAEQGQLGTYRPDQKNYIGTAPYGGAGQPGDMNKQVYEGSTADWDGNTYRERQFREETERNPDGSSSRSYRQETTQEVMSSGRDPQGRPLSGASTGSSGGRPDDDISSHMESVSIGGRKQPPPVAPKGRPPGTAPKPGQQRGGYGPGQGGADGDLPPPPPELMDQMYMQQRQPDKPQPAPVEIVYVTDDSSPRTARKMQEDQNRNQKPLEVTYTGGLAPSPGANRKNTPSPKTLPKPGKFGSTSSMPRSPTGDPSNEALTGVRKGDPRYDVLAGSRAPSGDPLGTPAGDWTNPPNASSKPTPGGQQQQDDQADFPPPPPLPSSAPPGGDDQQQQQQPGYGRPPYGGPGQQQQQQHPVGPGSGARIIPVQRENQVGSQPGGSPYQRQYPFGGGRGAQGAGGEEPGQQAFTGEVEHEYEPHDLKVYKSSLTVTPPSSFRPVPIEEKEPAPKPQPPSVPPKPFKDTTVFENVDTHAVEVSKMEHKSFRDLVWLLIYARDITNELEKARAIFLWLCSKDLSKLNFDNVDKDSPEEILMSLKSGSTTYAVVYETLCSYAGLHCKTLSGYAKGAEYKPGMKFKGEQGQHSWNAVLVDGSWRLVDCHWAARRLVGKKVTVENIRYELDEYYFMPDPHQLIFTHFPEDPNWQLLKRAISLGDFENLVPVKSAFFKYGLQIMSHKEAVINTQREVTIRIGCPPMKASTLAFTFTLAYNDTGKEEFRGMKLNRFGMQEMVDNVSFVTVRPPERGSYRLILYSKDLSRDSQEGVYGGVCEYEVVCTGGQQPPQPFPPCVHTSWGPGDSAHKYHLEPQQKGAIFSTVNGQAELRFKIPKALRFTAKLKTNERDDKALAGYVLHRVVGATNEQQAVFTITAPNRGEYGLEIYANDPDVDGNALFHAYQYLIICMEDPPAGLEPLPLLPPGYLGPQPMYSQVGLSGASHQDPYIQLEGSDLEMSFRMKQPLRVTSQLIYVSHGQQEDLSDYVLQQGRGDIVSLQIKLPKAGLYKYQMYALPYSDSSESLPGVYNYLLNCHQVAGVAMTFPKQYGQWKEGCFLHYPQEGTISRSVGMELPFKVSVPKANSVAVVIGEEWTQLNQDNEGAWEGVVQLAQFWGKESKLTLCANYGNVKSSYSTLLEFSI